MARQKRKSRSVSKAKRRGRPFGKLPVSEVAGNTADFINNAGPRFVQKVLALRREKGQEPESCQGVW